MKNDSFKQSCLGGKIENPLKYREFNFQPNKMALAHEVRNPLTNINLAVAMLRPISDPDQEIFLDIISRASAKIDDLIHILLSPAGNAIFQSGKYSIHKLLNEVLLMIRDRIILKNITVIKEYADHDCDIDLNEPDIKMAFTNIIVNAIESINHEKGVIKIITKSNEGKFIIQIADNGCGISKKDLKKIFEPYFTKKPRGLGIGLATTFEMLRANHIEIHIESALNKGTCVTLTLNKCYN